MPEIKVVSMEPRGLMQDIGKGTNKFYRYIQPVRYTLEDGQTIDSNKYALTKPKLAKLMASEQNYIEKGGMLAKMYSGDWIFTFVFSVGAA